MTSPSQLSAAERGFTPDKVTSPLASVGVPVRPVRIAVDAMFLLGELAVPPNASGVVLFAHSSPEEAQGPCSPFVAQAIQAAGIATMRFDLLSPEETQENAIDGRLTFNVELLSLRLIHAVRWINTHPEMRGLGIGCFGVGTGGAAALMAAAELGGLIQATVSLSGWPDLVGDTLARVFTPTLLIVGEWDQPGLEHNESALALLGGATKQLALVAGAGPRIEEPGARDEVATLAAQWFQRHLHPRQSDAEP